MADLGLQTLLLPGLLDLFCQLFRTDQPGRKRGAEKADDRLGRCGRLPGSGRRTAGFIPEDGDQFLGLAAGLIEQIQLFVWRSEHDTSFFSSSLQGNIVPTFIRDGKFIDSIPQEDFKNRVFSFSHSLDDFDNGEDQNESTDERDDQQPIWHQIRSLLSIFGILLLATSLLIL